MADEAIPAATLIVVRDRADGPPELLMVERSEGMAFAAGALVFPGGRIDEADRRLAEQLSIDPHIVPGPNIASNCRPRSLPARISRTSSTNPEPHSIRPR
jgi:hypothetical protein